MLPEHMPEARRKLIAAGRTVGFDGKFYTEKDMSPEDKAGLILGPGHSFTGLGGRVEVLDPQEASRMKARISELEAENALLRGEVEGERITLTEDEGISKLHTLIEALLPTSKSAIENKAHADLALIAEYLGLPSEGLDKPALVESILTKLKES